MMGYKDRIKKRTEEYSKDYEKYGYSEKALSMPSDRRNIRYYELIKNFGFYINRTLDDKFVILDAGCGFGDINGYLQSLGYKKYQYIGLDVVDEFLSQARTLYSNKNIVFEKKDYILESIDKYNFDYAVSSQTFNNPYGEDIDNYIYLFKTIEKLYKQCRIGISFNFITDRGDERRTNIAYHNPLKVLEFAYSISKCVILDNSCFPYEATCTIIKDCISDNNMIYKSFMETYKEQFNKGIFIVKNK